MKRSKIFALFLMLAVVLVFSGLTQEKTGEAVTCPVSGKVMKKSEAEISYEYKGKTYYFCCEGCKEKFIQDPEKYTQKKAESQAVYTCPMHPEVKSDKPGKCPQCGMNLEKKAMMAGTGMHMHGKMEAAEHGCCNEGCVLHAEDVEVKTEKTSDGIMMKVTSKNAETVKKIQEHLGDGKHLSCCCCQESCAKETEKKSN